MKRHFLLAYLLCFSSAAFAQTAAPTTAFGITDDMGAGWNLGNTLESTAPGKGVNTETAWGNPKTTKAMIDFVKKAGFRTLRVPVTWDDHISGGGNTIDAAWLSRVEEVVNYGLNNQMYVILNMHHDALTHQTTQANESNIKTHVTMIWQQISDRFKNYDNHLIFEVMNEPRNGEDWTGKQEYYDVVNRLGAAALATIRATGGNNAGRLVMVPGYCASAGDVQINPIIVPNDKMVAVSTHAYFPFSFSMDLKGTTVFVATDVDDVFKRLKAKFIDKGIPVIMGEWGADNKNNLSERVKHAEYYTKTAKTARIPTVVWDNNNSASCCNSTDNMGLLNRSALSWYFPTIIDAIIRGSSIVAAQIITKPNSSATGSIKNIAEFSVTDIAGRIIATNAHSVNAAIPRSAHGLFILTYKDATGRSFQSRIVQP